MATIRNLPEDFLYQKLPAALLELDERGIISAVCGGLQDRYEDLRAYSKGMQRFLEPGALPQTTDNAVLVDLTGFKGKAYTRSLDITDTTPAAEGAKLVTWAARELGLEAAALSNVRFGIDPLRSIDAAILDHLAATIGAILYNSSALTAGELPQAREDLVATWFPRLRLKGTARSFDTLGRILGFEDIRFTPLYSRLSPRDPGDVGSAANDPDFSATPEFWPQQVPGPLYDPQDLRHGPFYTWTGTASHGTAATDFYPQIINGLNPWISVTVLDVQYGTVTHPAAGSYALGSSGTLSEGGAHHKAYVDPLGSSIRFNAIAEGDSFNGLHVHVMDLDDPTRKAITVDDRLSALQYRSSFFDLTMAMTFERAGEVFGTQPMRANPDLVADPELVSDGTAVGPYRPWFSGSVAVERNVLDWLVQSGTISSVVSTRVQSAGTDRQENIPALLKASSQVAAAMEEVRPATRHLRTVHAGYTSTGTWPYAAYNEQSLLFVTTSGSTVYDGYARGFPLSATSTLLDGLAAFWRLDEAGIRYDIVNGIPLSATTRVPGKIGNAAAFTNNQSSSATDNVGPIITDSFTVAGWFKYTTNPPLLTKWFTILGMNAPGGNPGESGPGGNFRFRLQLDGTPGFTGTYTFTLRLRTDVPNGADFFGDYKVRNAAPIDSIGSGGVNARDEWFFVRAWYDAEAQIIGIAWNEYGPSFNTASVVGTMNPSSLDANAFYIGAFTGVLGTSAAPSNAFDSWGVWNRVLTHEEGAALYLDGAGRDYPFGPAPIIPAYGYNVGIEASENLTVDTTAITVDDTDITADTQTAARIMMDGETRPDDPGIFDFKAVTIPATGSYTVADNSYYFNFPASSNGVHVVAHWTPTTTELIRDEPTHRMKMAGTVAYQQRPEDGLDDGLLHSVYDDYPWRRDIVVGGELVETDGYAGTTYASRHLVSEEMAFPDHTGAEYTLYGYQSSGSSRLRLVANPRDTGDDYLPGQVAVAFTGNFRNLSTRGPDETELVVNPYDATNLRTQYSVTDLDRVLEPGWALYHAGMVQGVSVADPVGFFGTHHYDDLAMWLPLNEHPYDDLSARDAASITSAVAVHGVAPADRSFDTRHGAYLAMLNSEVTLINQGWLFDDEAGVSLWMRPGTAIGDSGTQTFLQLGPLSMDCSFAGTTVVVYAEGTELTREPVGTVAVNDWTFLYASVSASLATCSSGSFAGTITGTQAAGIWRAFTDTDQFIISAGERELDVRDVRAWTRPRTSADLTKIARHVPTATAALYWPSWLICANNQDRYGLKVLPTGWLEPDVLPPATKIPKLARIQRYDSLGRYQGEHRFHETGLGSGFGLPENYLLGTQLYEVTATGEVVYSGTYGALPGVNASWLYETTPGSYLALNGTVTGFAGTFDGTYAGEGTTGIQSPWPNMMVQTNPLREFIWVEGDDGYVYEVSLASSGSDSATMMASFVATGSMALYEQPTGAQVTLEGAGTHLTVGSGGTAVYQAGFSGTDTTPPLYMYLTNRVIEETDDAHARWTDRGEDNFGNEQDPQLAALDTAGILEFDNAHSLPAGNYRLILDTGNLGRTDADFDGFAVEIRVDTLILQKRLLRGLRGYNIRASESFEFVVPAAVNGAWILSIEWTNPFVDENAGTARRLAIYGYTLERIAPEAYRIELATTGTEPTITRLTTETFAGTTPGGWLASMTSYGTLASYRHESLVYPSNDTLTGKLPLSHLLTATTMDRAYDVILGGTFIPVVVTPEPVVTPATPTMTLSISSFI